MLDDAVTQKLRAFSDERLVIVHTPETWLKSISYRGRGFSERSVVARWGSSGGLAKNPLDVLHFTVILSRQGRGLEPRSDQARKSLL